MSTQVYGIRGATTIDSNTAANIKKASVELIKELLDKNKIKSKDIVSITISSTGDITKSYPAKHIRECGLTAEAPLFSSLEPNIEGALPLCIRILLHTQGNTILPVRHIYLHGAKNLRPDIK